MSRAWLLLILPAFIAGCPGDGGGGTASDTDAEPPLEQPDDAGHNPGFRRILGGTTVAGDYTKVAVGRITRVSSSSPCCLDYVVAGPSENAVRILFGHSGKGLTFLSETPDQLFDMAPANVGIVDVVVFDLDQDGAQDVLALRDDGVVGIRRGLAASPPSPVLDATLSEVPLVLMNGHASRSLVIGDLDCDLGPDIAALDPEHHRVVAALRDGMGGFTAAFGLDLGAGSTPQSLVLHDLNASPGDELAAASIHGEAIVRNNLCNGGFDPPAVYTVFPSDPTPDTQIAVGLLCLGPDTQHRPALALGFADQVRVLCNDGLGDFSAEGEEPHGMAGGKADYLVDFNGGGGSDNERIFQMQFWGPTRSLHVLRKTGSLSSISRVVPLITQIQARSVAVAGLLGPAPYVSFALHQESPNADPHWTRMVFVAGDSIGFAR